MRLVRSSAKIYKFPTLTLQRLDEKGKIIETRLPQTTFDERRFKEGWSYSNGMTTATVPASAVDVGRWRVAVEGELDNKKWRSLPIDILVSDELGKRSIVQASDILR